MRAPILTERLLLRDIVEADGERLQGLDSDPEVMRFIGTVPPPGIAWYRDRIRTVYVPLQAHPWHGVRLVYERISEDFLGWVFIRPANAALQARALGWNRPDDVEVGYRLHRHAWGRGIATEAAAPLVRTALADPATISIVACAHAENAASLRVLAKLGLQRVGEVLLPEAGAPTVKLSRIAFPPRQSTENTMKPEAKAKQYPSHAPRASHMERLRGDPQQSAGPASG